jgi:N6-adenosine-specific RNA methylase IME4
MGQQKFRVLTADPPWKFGDSLPGKSRGAAKNYDVLTAERIETFLVDTKIPFNGKPTPIFDCLADDALLFLWEVSAMPREALDVMSAWGFTQKTRGIWSKVNQTDEELVLKISKLADKGDGTTLNLIEIAIEEARRLSFGMGRTLRGAHESFLVGHRGRPPIASLSHRSEFFAPIGRHSEKPAKFYEIVEALSPGPYLELFARSGRQGWTSHGKELRPDPVPKRAKKRKPKAA